MNSAFLSAMGANAEDSIGTSPPFQWWPEDDHESLLQLFNSIINGYLDEYEGFQIIVFLRMPGMAAAPFICSFKKLANGNTEISSTPFGREDLVSEAIDLLTESLAAAHGSRDDPAPFREQLASLSKRERGVLNLLLIGRRVSDIADQLNISIHTARNHRKAIFGKLGVRSQVELISRLGDLERGSPSTAS